MLREKFHRDFAKKIELGYWYRESADTRARLTLKGAYVSAWGELPPIKQWRLATARRRADWGL